MGGPAQGGALLRWQGSHPGQGQAGVSHSWGGNTPPSPRPGNAACWGQCDWAARGEWVLRQPRQKARGRGWAGRTWALKPWCMQAGAAAASGEQAADGGGAVRGAAEPGGCPAAVGEGGAHAQAGGHRPQLLPLGSSSSQSLLWAPLTCPSLPCSSHCQRGMMGGE